MKKLLSIILSLLMLLPLIASCEWLPSPDDSLQEEPVQYSYYETIEFEKEVMSKSYLSHGDVYSSFADIAWQLDYKVSENLDESVFEGKKIIVCKTTIKEGFIGFKNIIWNGSEPIIQCEVSEPEVVEEAFGNIPYERAFLVLIPEQDLPYGFNNVEFSLTIAESYSYERVLHAPQLGDEEIVRVLKSDKDVTAFENEYGLQPHDKTISDNYIVIAHYMPNGTYDEMNVRYANLKFVDDNTFTIDRVGVYNEKIGLEYELSALHYIFIPKNEFFQDKEDLKVSIINKSEFAKTEKFELNSAPLKYLEMLLLLEGDGCNKEWLPTEYGTHFELIETDVELKELSGRSANSLFYENYVLAIYTYYENYDYRTIGFRNLRREYGRIILEVDEGRVYNSNGEFKSLAFVVVPKKIINEARIYNNTSFKLESNKRDFYYRIVGEDILKEEIPSPYPVKEEPYYISETYEHFKTLWKNEVDPTLFETHFALAIYRYKGSSAGYTLGYSDFYIEDYKLNITKHEGVEYIGNDAEYIWYDILFIPKSEAPELDSEAPYIIQTRTYSVHQNAIDDYWDEYDNRDSELYEILE